MGAGIIRLDVHCTAARQVSADAAASGSRQEIEAVCGVRHIFQTYMQYGTETKERFCTNQNTKKESRRMQHTPTSKSNFLLMRLLYGPASWTHTKGDTLDIAIVQPTEHPRTPPPGSKVSAHMLLNPSCVRLP